MFDLLRSNDVTLANKMESTGKPGTVHISEKTYAFLKDDYFVQEGSPVGGQLGFSFSLLFFLLKDINNPKSAIENVFLLNLFNSI